MSLRFHEISEANNHILNPFTDDKLALVGELARLTPATRILDLACGKGEMLTTWAQRWGISGVGVDISKVFLQAARERVAQANLSAHITFVEQDGADYLKTAQTFDVVSCLGATWIGGGLVGTLRLMLNAVKPDGLIIVGEPYWTDPPPDAAYDALGVAPDTFASLVGTLDRFESLDLDLVEMVLASPDSWDRYSATQWWAARDWLDANPDDPDHAAFGKWVAGNRRAYLEFERRYLGWGVFMLKRAA